MVNFWIKYVEGSITNRFFKHADVQSLLKNLPPGIFDIQQAGQSAEGLPISIVKCGSGKTRILLWSQMHGDEATATMALFDLFNFLAADDEFNHIRNSILSGCTLYSIVMLNPDGANRFTRRNAQGIDINRDFHRCQTPEGKLLRRLRDEINPHFGFNLHDQGTLWSAGSTGNLATISLLAPAFDEELSVNNARRKAMQVITCINRNLQHQIPWHVGRFDDEHEPRAFGDNFQKAGTATILIEAGGYPDDPEKQVLRKHFFSALLSGLTVIADKSYAKESIDQYFEIPENKKLHFHILLRNCQMSHNGLNYTTDIGLVAEEQVNENADAVTYTYIVEDVGDLTGRFGYENIDAQTYTILLTQPLITCKPADFVVRNGNDIILSVEHGSVTVKNIY